jgi:hypothetical protein
MKILANLIKSCIGNMWRFFVNAAKNYFNDKIKYCREIGTESS